MDCFEKPELAREIMFKELKLIDITVIPDEEIKTHKHAATEETMTTLYEEILHEGFNKGIHQGIEKGIEKGQQQGQKQKALLIAQNLLKAGSDKDFVKNMTGLSEQEIEPS